MRKLLLAAAGAALVVLPLLVSGQAPSSPTFDVASVKPNKSGPGPSMLQNQPGGRFNATNVPARLLIQQAYRLQGFQLVGGPAWLTSDRFDVVAKGSGDLAAPVFGPQSPQNNDPTPMQLAMRALLADRFKLVVHRETRELPIYALVFSGADKKLGAGIHASDADCAALAGAARGRGALPPPGPPAPGDRPPCGARIGFGNMAAGGMTLRQLASALSISLNRTVVDQTGLAGLFEIDLTWTPDQLPQRAPGTATDQPITVNGFSVDPNGPSIFTAVQEQLGLKLDSSKGPVDVLVIDSVEQPTED